MPVSAYILINVQIGKSAEVLEKIRNVRGVQSAAFTTGEYDLIIRITVDNLEELYNVTTNEIHKIPGILKTTTFVIEKEIR
ncbi:MAG: Lrp/AsnC family transcriptional regulator [Candidatus Asgardarchaeia archaeon]|nr:MAG: Lrp/AsnC family transcriptional regulator [Candidatus Asgardarchaeum californiense]